MHSEESLKLAMTVLRQQATLLPDGWEIQVRFSNDLFMIRLVDDGGKEIDTESEGVEPSDFGHLVQVAKDLVAARPKCPDHPDAKTNRFWADLHGPGFKLKRGYKLSCVQCGKDLGWEDGTTGIPVKKPAAAIPDADLNEVIAAFDRDFPVGTAVYLKLDGLFEEPTVVKSQAFCSEGKAVAMFFGIREKAEIKGRVRKISEEKEPSPDGQAV